MLSNTHIYGNNESGAEGTDNAIDITSYREDMRGAVGRWGGRSRPEEEEGSV
jgi:hypothetical protein